MSWSSTNRGVKVSHIRILDDSRSQELKVKTWWVWVPDIVWHYNKTCFQLFSWVSTRCFQNIPTIISKTDLKWCWKSRVSRWMESIAVSLCEAFWPEVPLEQSVISVVGNFSQVCIWKTSGRSLNGCWFQKKDVVASNREEFVITSSCLNCSKTLSKSLQEGTSGWSVFILRLQTL